MRPEVYSTADQAVEIHLLFCAAIIIAYSNYMHLLRYTLQKMQRMRDNNAAGHCLKSAICVAETQVIIMVL